MNGGDSLRWLLTSRSGGVLIASVVAGVSSAVATYKFVDKKQAKKYELQADKDLAEAREFYYQLAKDGAFAEYSKGEVSDETVVPDVEDNTDETVQSPMVAEAVEIMQRQGYIPYDQPEKIAPAPEEVVEVTASLSKNIWTENEISKGIDVADVTLRKSKGRPYIITFEEFADNELEWEQRHLTWFEGDEVLSDEVDEEIRESDQLIDLSNLLFGVGTADSNAVYIANASTQTLFEVTRSTGSFAIEVMALADEDQNVNQTLRKMRPEM